MCYFLYASLYGKVSEADYNIVQSKYEYKISLGTKHDVKLAVMNSTEYVEDDYRITDWVCDCDSPVGKRDVEDPMITELSNLIIELSELSGVKQINICKTWIGRRNKKEISLNLKDTDIPEFLANLEPNKLYSLEVK